MKIWVHTLVKNEENFLWFSVASIVGHVDKVLLWDTGSTDNTWKIIRELEKKFPKKISVKQVGEVDINSFTSVRQQMLDETDADWFVIVDGDEVWWDESIAELVKVIRKRGSEIETIVNGYYNLVGDIFHHQDESAGAYKIDGNKGHITIRAINRKIPGLHLDKPHGTQGFFDGRGKPVQERDKSKRIHLGGKYLHFTHLPRTSAGKSKDVPKRTRKYKREIGEPFAGDFYYPEAFFLVRPNAVGCPWKKFDANYRLRATLETPLRRMKRKIVRKVGY